MAIIKLQPENTSNTTVEFSPRRIFSSGSGGLTGSINVIVNRSPTQRDSVDMREGLTNTEGPQKFSENTFEGRREMIYNARFNTVGQGNIFSETETPFNYELQLALLMDGASIANTDEDTAIPGSVHHFDDVEEMLQSKDGKRVENPWPPELFKAKYSQLNLNFAQKGYSDLPMHPRNAYQLHCSRSVPGTDFASKAYRKKEIIRNVLEDTYQIGRPGYGWGYGNFNCINLFKTSTTNTPAIVYNSNSNRYLPTSSLQIDFRIKVNRYPTETGTIMHLPGAFAVSVVTGSSTDENNRPTHYKLLLQLGTDSTGSMLPNSIDMNIANLDRGSTQVYQSLPNITASHWHDCSIRFNESENNATGSFVIDGILAGTFEPTGSFAVATKLTQDRNILSLGAFYSGSAADASYFFSSTAASNQGVENVLGSAGDPENFFCNPLDAEIHEVKISNDYRSIKNIKEHLTLPVTASDHLLFHVPVLYSSDSPINFYNAMIGDLFNESGTSTNVSFLHEFYENFPVPVQKSFDSPFNTHHANIGGFCNINAQAFLRDFKTGRYPYLHNLSASVRSYSSQHEMSSSWSLFDEHQRRNLLIMPCDDGDFKRTYDIYPDSQLTGSVVLADRPEIIKVDNIGRFDSNYDSKLIFVDEGWTYHESENLEPPSLFPTLEEMSTPIQSLPKAKDNPPTIPTQRFFDPAGYGLIGDSERSSNMIVIFSIPTLFYGNQIRPGTVKMFSDMYRGGGTISGDGEFVKGDDYRMTTKLCDDSHGNIIRCDTSGSLSTANFVGSVYYEDGIIALKSPHLFNFGAHNFTLEFEGVQNTHILELLVPVPRNTFNSSSNPNYNAFKPYADANEEADSFMYLSTLNFHDSNLNVIAKARMAQPVIKRLNDKYLFRVKFDF